MNRRRSTATPLEKKLAMCVCGATFQRNSSAHKTCPKCDHARGHGPEKLAYCELCGQSFLRVRNRKVHCDDCIRKPKEATCSDCGKTFLRFRKRKQNCDDCARKAAKDYAASHFTRRKELDPAGVQEQWKEWKERWKKKTPDWYKRKLANDRKRKIKRKQESPEYVDRLREESRNYSRKRRRETAFMKLSELPEKIRKLQKQLEEADGQEDRRH